ncbi:MAG: type II toxin-antitoxin system VapB family antitoxin, partial [Actinomycetota bacterium]
MSRTNIDIDDELIERVMRRYRVNTKREAVDLALRRAVGEPMTREEFLALEGIGWNAD